ncbi:methyl-accepting chemotaxis protein [Rubrivivax gelatinosus]|uniref:Methyl-accepting chemotaxis protein/methyl-accepting chemotaxis protein-1 (Serine sensor receptor) n=1 Tax=Rubrivivax gelatinosus TaxID=28068 RepID=A0A4R2M5P7_RUBGE|nr:methyl-accepting chemotaxis protein [Rubrivivax gelatinosus]MBK1690371.1 hypothetical protein [Rubrivivax gelatinosus]TCP01371.1 methyl-accepting chemotaxis protein/methyl-accepting chemotaxis protein-1 (serine sensor receptor) [Rubrivivax gelatinosus]
MSKLSFRTVAGRLSGAFGLQILLCCACVVIAVVSLQGVSREVGEIRQRLFSAIDAANTIERVINVQAVALRDAIVARDDAEALATMLKTVGESAKVNDAATKALEATVPDEASARALFEAMVVARKAYAAEAWEVVALLKKGDHEAAATQLRNRVQPVQARYFETVANIRAAATGLMNQATAHTEATAARATLAMIVAAALAVALGVAMALLITRGLVRQLGGEPADVVRVAGEIARGNLAVQVPKAAAGNADSAMAAIGVMRDRLAEIVQNVRRNVDSMATGAAEIASGNADLSQRTEMQAAALQQTAATMDELGSTVRQNADNAARANGLAREASSVAHTGGEVVSRVVDTMRGISDGSRRIADITGVIDGIAFQTNILALNAAVEAARAGEQGRGFAVVAGEVRSLAQRAAAAAREIKTLISQSTEQTESGAELVDQAGVRMKEIVAAIARVSEMVAAISAASAEQSVGVAQVGEAVQQLDQATQQNAALVEQSAAAAASLRQQSAQLVDSVAVFRLERA